MSDIVAVPTAEDLAHEQERVARLRPPPWSPPDGDLVLAACFVAFLRGEQGPGRAGDRAWSGAVLWSPQRGELARHTTLGRAGAPYEPGLLFRRESGLVVAALEPLIDRADVLLVDATGRDHPRRAGLALHLGHHLDVASVGVTHRPLVATKGLPSLPRRGDRSVVERDGEPVAAWVCTADRVRPVVAHAAWRTDVDTAVAVTLRASTGARTPEPLRLARTVAREARSAGSPPVA